MADKKKAKKKKGKKNKSGGWTRQDAVMREILGILVITLALISAISLWLGTGQATTLAALRSVYVKLFGLTALSVPVIVVLAGALIITRNKRIAALMLHVFLLTGLVGGLLSLWPIDPGRDFIVGRDMWTAGGGAIPAIFTRPLSATISVPGAFLVIVAAGMIYAKLALKISYIEVWKKVAPYAQKAGTMAGTAIATVVGKARVLIVEAIEKRRQKLRELAEKKEREREEKAQQLKEEEAKRIAEERDSFGMEENQREEPEKDELADLEPVAPGPPELDLEPVDDGLPDDYDIEISEEDRCQKMTVGSEGEEEEIIWKLPEPEDWLDIDASMKEPAIDNTMRERLESMLKSFQVPARISNVVKGSSFTRFEIELEPGTKVSRIVSLEADIALSLATDSKTIRIEAPIPGKSAIGIEIPNKERGMVPMAEFVQSEAFGNLKTPLSFVLGEDIDGQPVFGSIVKMPHLLVAGSTGSGKSVCLNGIITNIIAREYPTEVRFVMVDMKRVELTPYDGIPHLLSPVILEAPQAANSLRWMCSEMDRRYKKFAEVGVRNIDGFNSFVEDPEDRMFRIVFVIDELADLMMVSSPSMNIENYICRIAQLARATGIHLILATQRPDTKVITGTIKNNIPSRVAFSVASQIDSRTIIDTKGAESLLGKGDMLYQPFGSNKLKRLQGAFVSDAEVKRLVKFWKDQGIVEYTVQFDGGDTGAVRGDGISDEFLTEDEKLYQQACEIVVTTQQASISMIQRRLRIGYNRAARLVELMEERSVVGPHDGSRPREVLVSSMDQC